MYTVQILKNSNLPASYFLVGDEGDVCCKEESRGRTTNISVQTCNRPN